MKPPARPLRGKAAPGQLSIRFFLFNVRLWDKIRIVCGMAGAAWMRENFKL